MLLILRFQQTQYFTIAGHAVAIVRSQLGFREKTAAMPTVDDLIDIWAGANFEPEQPIGGPFSVAFTTLFYVERTFFPCTVRTFTSYRTLVPTKYVCAYVIQQYRISTLHSDFYRWVVVLPTKLWRMNRDLFWETGHVRVQIFKRHANDSLGIAVN